MIHGQWFTGLVLTQIGTLFVCTSCAIQVWSMWKDANDSINSGEHLFAARLASGVSVRRKERGDAVE